MTKQGQLGSAPDTPTHSGAVLFLTFMHSGAAAMEAGHPSTAPPLHGVGGVMETRSSVHSLTPAGSGEHASVLSFLDVCPTKDVCLVALASGG